MKKMVTFSGFPSEKLLDGQLPEVDTCGKFFFSVIRFWNGFKVWDEASVHLHLHLYLSLKKY